MSLDRRLLSLLAGDAEAIAEVWEMGLRVEAFEEPISARVYSFVTEYWLGSKKKVAPTAFAIETESPGFKVATDVEETASWLARKVLDRAVTNRLQMITMAAAKRMHDDPHAALNTLRESADDATRHLGIAGKEERARIWNALDLKATEQPRWLARSRLPRAAVALLLGDEGIGKSLFWALLITHITTGQPFEGFGVPAREPGLVVLVLTEDDWSSDVRPRLEVAGVDLKMVKVFCSEGDGSGSPVFPRDIHEIEAMDPKPVLVVVDCWLDTVPADKKISDPQQARAVLHPWKELATRTDAAVMLLGHTNRIASANPREKYGATYALRQKCRLTLFAQQGQDGELLIGPEKANGAAIERASIFKVDTKQLFSPSDEHDGKVPHLRYVGASDKTAKEHLAENYATDTDTSGKTDAVAWLAALLGPDPRWSTDVHKAREQEKIGLKRFNTAKIKLRVESKRVDGDGSWFMRLPHHGDRIPDAPPQFPDLLFPLIGNSGSLGRSEGDSPASSNGEGSSSRSEHFSEDPPRSGAESVDLPPEAPSRNNNTPPTSQDIQNTVMREAEGKGNSGGGVPGAVLPSLCGTCVSIPCLCPGNGKAEELPPGKPLSASGADCVTCGEHGDYLNADGLCQSCSIIGPPTAPSSCLEREAVSTNGSSDKRTAHTSAAGVASSQALEGKAQKMTPRSDLVGASTEVNDD
jgi:AAA domain